MKKTKTLKMAQLALFIAILLAMAFTPLGYFRAAGLEITLLMIPVTVGAIVLGPKAGAILGLTFGLTSFAISATSGFGATLLTISPVKHFILCVGTRVAAGWLAGMLFKVFEKANFKGRYTVTSFISPMFNTVFFMSFLVIFFYNTEFIQNIAQTLGATNPIMFMALFAGIQGIGEAIVCCIVAGIISKNLYKVVNK